MIKKFRKLPVVIEAIQFTGRCSGVEEIVAWAGDKVFPLENTILITTSEGEMTANIYDWIIKGIKGEFYPCKPDIFDATYEPEGSEGE